MFVHQRCSKLAVVVLGQEQHPGRLSQSYEICEKIQAANLSIATGIFSQLFQPNIGNNLACSVNIGNVLACSANIGNIVACSENIGDVLACREYMVISLCVRLFRECP